MKTRILSGLSVVVLVTALTSVWGVSQSVDSGKAMTANAKKFVRLLDDKQRKTVLQTYDSKERVGWHFIPKDHRKGLQIKHMTGEQRKAAFALLQSCLSNGGFRKARQIMELEGVLHQLEGGKGRFARDPERYYYTLFGDPDKTTRWGLSIEGHHLSLNFVIDKNQVISATPAFFAANPGIVKSAVPKTKIKKGTRVLAAEELLGFELVNSLTEEQKKVAIIAKETFGEIRAAGAAQPPTDAPAGISLDKLNADQKKLVRRLVGSYITNFPRDMVSRPIKAIREAGEGKIHFAWAGALKPGIGHYYRIQGPSFLIEFVNKQPDAAGNPANHIHAVWRDMRGDFALPIGKKSRP